mmetsp:Transcript_7626/g.8582  ORF Transcript_7626/g.8582 Transcript_7626/m.8582 type:complete len:166 (+) Transcript_7626:33-530(+)
MFLNMEDSNIEANYEQDQYISTTYTPCEKCNRFRTLIANSRILMKCFLSLYDNRYERELTLRLKNKRNEAENVIFFSSLGGRVLGLSYLTKQLFNGRKFSPIRNISALCVTFGAMYLLDTVPLALYWHHFEDTLIKRDDGEEYTEDPYAVANLSSFKVWYYQRIY